MSDPVNSSLMNGQRALELGAWVLPISPETSVAIGRYELKHIEFINTSVTLPGLPAFCEQGFIWRNQFVPMLDLQSLINRRRMAAVQTEQLAAIIAFERSQGDLAVGAILLRGVPKLIRVAPAQSVATSELHSDWQRFSHAAFRDNDVLYPVLDLCCLFDKSPADLLLLH